MAAKKTQQLLLLKQTAQFPLMGTLIINGYRID